MRKLVGMILVTVLVAGAVFAQTRNFDVDDSQATVTQSVTVTIPERVALHIDTSSWALDLDALAGQTCFPVSKTVRQGLGEDWDANFVQFMNNLIAEEAGIFNTDTSWDEVRDVVIAHHAKYNIHPATSYPVADINGSGNIDGDHDKGYLVCYFGKVIQKFANTPWAFDANLSLLTADVTTYKGFGQFGLADVLDNALVGHFTTDDANGVDWHRIAGGDHTQGWLDDYIVEAFYFDGTEVPGTHSLLVTYTLATVP